ncbi:hypothetical protein [Lentilactobacillus sunkii]|uniref:SpoVT-AbrB domain-containing protein n=1 Tax=Lentilactobacillus sunkii DSM 19904 TaxID=1423808 RepID=A0A0R1L1V1_9LACO|nr:hypothetical protein [Lentilactobacillus sunkii]KRK87028.1 hypothetical protein FD17_GL001489 [Lentilactobacillus sunkii DSM 19904]
MKKIKVRKIGNSLGVILPRTTGIHEGDELHLMKKGEWLILDMSEANINRARAIIQKGFDDFKYNRTLTEDEMASLLGKYGWHK